MRLAIALAVLATPALAYQDPTKVAVDLGGILGSEVDCGFVLVADAVASYVKANIDPSNEGFASALYMMSNGTKAQIQGMTASERAAHCQATKARADLLGLTTP